MNDILTGVRADTPTHRRTVTELADDELTIELDLIRARRLAALEAYTLAVEKRQAYKREQDREKLAHELYMLEKEFASLDKAIAKVEKRIRNVAVLRVSAELVG